MTTDHFFCVALLFTSLFGYAINSCHLTFHLSSLSLSLSLLSPSSPSYRSVEQAEEKIQSGLDIHQFMPRSRPSRSRVSSLMLVTPPPSPSPMMSRRTTVIEEWSQLQRTRSLSQSKSDRGGEKQGSSATKVKENVMQYYYQWSKILLTSPPGSPPPFCLYA